VELELGRVRGEIERIGGRKEELDQQRRFRDPQRNDSGRLPGSLVPIGPFSMLARFRKAAVEGYRTTIESIVDAIAFLLSMVLHF
jgi:hypothetical protein